MSDTLRSPDNAILTHREIEESIRRAEMARADYMAEMFSRFFNRLRGGLRRPGAASAARWDRLGEPVDRQTTLEVG